MVQRPNYRLSCRGQFMHNQFQQIPLTKNVQITCLHINLMLLGVSFALQTELFKIHIPSVLRPVETTHAWALTLATLRGLMVRLRPVDFSYMTVTQVQCMWFQHLRKEANTWLICALSFAGLLHGWGIAQFLWSVTRNRLRFLFWKLFARPAVPLESKLMLRQLHQDLMLQMVALKWQSKFWGRMPTCWYSNLSKAVESRMWLGVITHYINGVFFTVHGYTADLLCAKAWPLTRFALAVPTMADLRFLVRVCWVFWRCLQKAPLNGRKVFGLARLAQMMCI